MPDLNELLGRTLIIVAHADDEAVAFGALLQRVREPLVVFCTDGAPRDEYFWRAFGSRENYARVREEEACRALGLAGVHRFTVMRVGGKTVADQELFRHIPQAIDELMGIASHLSAEAILTLAYEGGHPDHDACNFIARHVANATRAPIWEAPLYHRAAGNKMAMQQFIRSSGGEIEVDIRPAELAAKREMFRAYQSQTHVLQTFVAHREVARPMMQYDYARPPHEGRLNYEAWGWPIRGWEVCDQFVQYLNAEHAEGSFRASEKRIA